MPVARQIRDVPDEVRTRSRRKRGARGSRCRRTCCGWSSVRRGRCATSRLRRFEQREILTPTAVEALAAEVTAAEVTELPPDAALLAWVWQHRHNLTADDASLVALAVRHQAVLVTTDGRLVGAAQALDVEVVVPA